MKTIRIGVFETNSSSEHVLTVNDGMRDVSQFPKKDDDDCIHIRLVPGAWLDGPYDTFEKMVQFMVVMAVREEGFDSLLTDKDISSRLYRIINLAYKMAGLGEIDEVIFDPPTDECGGIHINSYSTTLFEAIDNSLGVLWSDLDHVIDNVSFYVMNNNVARSLVMTYAPNEPIKLAYTAAALAMNTVGQLEEH